MAVSLSGDGKLNACLRRCTPDDAWCTLPSNYSLPGAVPVEMTLDCSVVPDSAKLWEGTEVMPGYWQLSGPDRALCLTGNVEDELHSPKYDAPYPYIADENAWGFRLVATPCASLGATTLLIHPQLFTINAASVQASVPFAFYIQSVSHPSWLCISFRESVLVIFHVWQFTYCMQAGLPRPAIGRPLYNGSVFHDNQWPCTPCMRGLGKDESPGALAPIGSKDAFLWWCTISPCQYPDIESLGPSVINYDITYYFVFQPTGAHSRACIRRWQKTRAA